MSAQAMLAARDELGIFLSELSLGNVEKQFAVLAIVNDHGPLIGTEVMHAMSHDLMVLGRKLGLKAGRRRAHSGNSFPTSTNGATASGTSLVVDTLAAVPRRGLARFVGEVVSDSFVAL